MLVNLSLWFGKARGFVATRKSEGAWSAGTQAAEWKGKNGRMSQNLSCVSTGGKSRRVTCYNAKGTYGDIPKDPKEILLRSAKVVAILLFCLHSIVTCAFVISV